MRAGARALLSLTALLQATCAGEPTSPLAFDAGAASWKAWVAPLSALDVSTLPPAAVVSAQELNDIVERQRLLTAGDRSAIAHWSGLPTTPWTRYALDRLNFYWPLLPDVRVATPARAARVMALLHTAMYDALRATWELKYRTRRGQPWADHATIANLAREDRVPGYPDGHVAVAAAAVEVLRLVLPAADTVALRIMQREVERARSDAGAAYASDIAAAQRLGALVGQLAMVRAAGDGSGAVWSGSVPAGELKWRPTPPRQVQVPFDVLAGTWKPWVLARGDAYRLPAPPSRTEARFTAALAELQSLSRGSRTTQQADLARRWATDAPSTAWEEIMLEEIAQRETTPLAAIRAQALVSVAMYDAFVAGWDSKFAWWLARPISVDPSLTTVYSTPPFPSYPSGHSTISTAAAEVMSYLFSDRASHFATLAREASLSRVWGGVHYRFDIEDGEALGQRVGRDVVTWARADGSTRAAR